jgi:hypothetical protein
MNEEFSALIKYSFGDDGNINNYALKELLVNIINNQEEIHKSIDFKNDILRDEINRIEIFW